ncbi:60S ribosomal export protein NMD3 [Termitomyces sp. J132]|nr:60S ribosomal export protein NMD3 [Termitomyces sp. J132]
MELSPAPPVHRILCADCDDGRLRTPIVPNSTNLCTACLRICMVDITEGIPKQGFEIKYLIQHGQCPNCTKLTAKNTWDSLVQAQQKVPHKKLFNLSNLSPPPICTHVGNSIHLIDPTTLQYYWHTLFDSLATIMDLVEFTVLDVKPDHCKTQDKFVMADAQVVVASAFHFSADTADNNETTDFDVPSSSTSQIYHTHTHLRLILQPCNTVMGYHLTNANFHSSDFALLGPGHILNIILVKKAYLKKSKAHTWKLCSISKEAGEEGEMGNARGVVGRLWRHKKVDGDYERS